MVSGDLRRLSTKVPTSIASRRMPQQGAHHKMWAIEAGGCDGGGTVISGALSRSVAARRIERRRPSGRATTMKAGPRAERSAVTCRR